MYGCGWHPRRDFGTVQSLAARSLPGEVRNWRELAPSVEPFLILPVWESLSRRLLRAAREGRRALSAAERVPLRRTWRHWCRAHADGVLAPGQAPVRTVGQPDVVDPGPEQRTAAKQRLRNFLLKGQRTWSGDGGVEVRREPKDPRVAALWDVVLQARQRRPTERLEWGADPRGWVGRIWDLRDFRSLPAELYSQLEELEALECRQVTLFAESGTYFGDVTSAEGALELGLGEGKMREWRDGVDFELVEPAPYNAPPYSAVYSNLTTLSKACAEFNRTLRVGKLVPLRVLPRVESPISCLVKEAVLEPDGKKYRICVDLTKSLVNPSTTPPWFKLPTIVDIITSMGQGWWVAKQDITDCFLNWKVAPAKWTVLGIQHPLTGQPYVYPALPFGFALSPYLSCDNTQKLADVISETARLRAKGARGRDVLCESDLGRIRLFYLLSGIDPDLFPPVAHCFVDDYIDVAPSLEACEEMIEIAALAFAAAGVKEKLAKREGSSQVMTILGFEFDSRTGILRVPAGKVEEILRSLQSILDRTARSQSVSCQELLSITGKLTWAATGIELGRSYVRHVRKGPTAVQDMLPTRQAREKFCIPLYLPIFQPALKELQWWVEALDANQGRHRWHVGCSGRYESWAWKGKYGETIPEGVIQFATDASTFGGGITYEAERRERRWRRHERNYHINVLEALMLLDWCVEFGESARGQRVLAWCDNAVTVAAVNKGSSRSTTITDIVRRVRLLCLKHDFHLCAAHIPGELNFEPDALSRGTLEARFDNGRLGARSFNHWAEAFGGFHRDAFCSPSGFDSRSASFCSALDPPFGRSFGGERVWAFPPSTLVEKTVTEAASWGADLVVAALPLGCGAEAQGWELIHTYSRAAHVLERPVGERWVRARESGFELGIYTLGPGRR